MSPNERSLVVCGAGLVAALGRDLGVACAAARAGLTRAQPIIGMIDSDPVSGDSEPLSGHRVFGIPAGAQGLGRLSRLAAAGLNDLLRRSDTAKYGRIGLYINLSNGFYYDRWVAQSDGEFDSYTDYLHSKYIPGLMPAIMEQLDSPIQFVETNVHFGGDCGIIDLLSHANGKFQNGEIDAAILGGVDSLVDPHLLDVLDELGVLKSASRPDGLIPGEAAAFICLASRQDSSGDNHIGATTVADWSRQQEKLHRFAESPSLGAAMAESILESTEGRRAASDFQMLLNTMGGDYYRASDWGNTMCKLGGVHELSELQQVHTATSYGDTGAASGFVAAIQARWLLSRRHKGRQSALVCVSGDDGSRGSFCISQCLSN